MSELNLSGVSNYIEENIWTSFHAKKLAKIQDITLNDIIKRKNPYLFKAKNSQSASEFIKSVLDASLSSGEETTFGNFMEQIALFVCQQVYDGRKSGIKGVDLEFELDNVKHIVSIKSGPNWGNAGQIAQMLANFKTAQKTLQTSGGSKEFAFKFVEGCCYGTDANPNKGTHYKLCGQDFWKLISGGSETLYKDLIVPLGHKAKEQNDKIQEASAQKLNTLTAEFVKNFCDDMGAINWDALIEHNSGRKIPKVKIVTTPKRARSKKADQKA